MHYTDSKRHAHTLNLHIHTHRSTYTFTHTHTHSHLTLTHIYCYTYSFMHKFVQSHTSAHTLMYTSHTQPLPIHSLSHLMTVPCSLFPLGSIYFS